MMCSSTLDPAALRARRTSLAFALIVMLRVRQYHIPSRSRLMMRSVDPYCCDGNDAATHQGYGNEYGQNALAFVKSKLG